MARLGLRGYRYIGHADSETPGGGAVSIVVSGHGGIV